MRREEAEQEAAWRNANDERRTRLEFYAFDASAGLSDDAWEITMRLRRDRPAPQPPTSAAPDATASPAPSPVVDEPYRRPARRPPEPRRAAPRRREREPRRRPPTPEPAEAETRRHPSDTELRRERRRAAERPRPRRAERTERAERRRTERAERRAHARAEPREPILVRLSRLVGGTVIAVALMWVALITALAVLVRLNSPTGLGIYAAAVVVGLIAIWFGFAVRRP